MHYVPLSLKGDEWHAAVRFFTGSRGASLSSTTRGEDKVARDSGSGSGAMEGPLLAQRIAQQGRDWAPHVFGREQMEVWLFRLLLEYGRVIDDNRENIGYV